MLIPVTAIAAAGAISYASVSPTSQLWGRTITHVPSGDVALTFDDGPNGDATLRLLDVLGEHGARATFFLIGRYARKQPAIVRRLAENGHTVANHTMSHPNLFWCSPRRTLAEMSDTNAVLEDVTGARVTLFRPPFGMRRPDTLRIARGLALTPVLWSVTCFDWQASATAEKILAHSQRGIERNQRRQRGSIVLLHDGSHASENGSRGATVEATRRLLAARNGNTFVAL